MKDFAIVVIGYNRPKSIQRLLNSLLNADYNGDYIDLIISIDKSFDNRVSVVSDKFSWPYGEKRVINHETNLGLRKHVIKCGEYLSEYENIIVLEDDIYVSRTFYNFAKQATEFYKEDDDIAGISLYQHKWNVGCSRLFEARKNAYDVYLMQYASSWGQIWNKKKWNEFMEWYKEIDDNFNVSLIPGNVCKWPSSSWLKYHIRYCIEKNKFFVYPYNSLSTNFGDTGTHVNLGNSNYQVSLEENENKIYKFSNKSNLIKYDAFFENIEISNKMIDNFDIEIDLYGMKSSVSKRYLLSTKPLNYKIISSYGYNMRPHEMNVINEIEGDIIKLYDTYIKEENLMLNEKKINNIKTQYDIKDVNFKNIIRLTISKYYANFKFRFKKLKKWVTS